MSKIIFVVGFLVNRGVWTFAPRLRIALVVVSSPSIKTSVIACSQIWTTSKLVVVEGDLRGVLVEPSRRPPLRRLTPPAVPSPLLAQAERRREVDRQGNLRVRNLHQIWQEIRWRLNRQKGSDPDQISPPTDACLSDVPFVDTAPAITSYTWPFFLLYPHCVGLNSASIPGVSNVGMYVYMHVWPLTQALINHHRQI